MNEYYELGEICPNGERDFQFPMTSSLVNACRVSQYVQLVETRLLEGEGCRTEILVVDVGDATVVSGNVGGIYRNERVAITVTPEHRVPVVVRPLRKNFPSLPHQHPTDPGSPRALCLYNASWEDVRRGWTAELFLQRLFWWLRQSSQMLLHRDDQPLEHLFFTAPCQIILPSNHLDFAKGDEKFLILQKVESQRNFPFTLRAFPATPQEVQHSGVPGFRILPIIVEGTSSTEVTSFPENLGALHEKLVSWGSNLLVPLKEKVREMIPQGGISRKQNVKNNLLILVWVPRVREDKIERYDVLGYLLRVTLFDLAHSFDLIHAPDSNGQYFHTPLIGVSSQGPSSDDWRSHAVGPVEIRMAMDKHRARDLSAIDTSSAEFNGILAGVGSLGGLLADMWNRQGWGNWTYVDPDQFLPHNIPRHIGMDFQLGLPKSDVLRELAKYAYPDNPLPKSIVGDITDSSTELSAAFSDATLLVDITTTYYAARDLSTREDAPRIASLFLTPSGNGCVLLLEDANRTIRASAMEAQYYRAILNNYWGKDHLVNHYGDVWVGGGCRDISVRLPYERVHLHAGLLSGQLRSSVLTANARACVWTVDATGAVSANEIPLSSVRSEQCGEWSVFYDDAIKEKLTIIRKQYLPFETGGIILGVTDMPSKSILLVDIVSAPADSNSSDKHFIRGKEGQEDLLLEVKRRTANIVDYIGEWHSHPDGYSTKPSGNDVKLLADLSELMTNDGLPAVMLIVGEKDMAVYVK